MSAQKSKVVIVEYRCQDAFKVPKGMDLDDETVVEDWCVKWNTLYIYLVDGKVLEIQSEWNAGEDMGDCLKHPCEDPTIENAEDYGLDDDDEGEDEICIGCGPTKEAKIVLYSNGEASCGECLFAGDVVTGIVCKKCDTVLPPHTVSEHLDVSNKIHECPHVTTVACVGCDHVGDHTGFVLTNGKYTCTDCWT